MPEKDHSNITLPEAIAWAKQNTAHNDVCKRLRSRAVVRCLLNRIEELENATNDRTKENFKRSIPESCNHVRNAQVRSRLGESPTSVSQ